MPQYAPERPSTAELHGPDSFDQEAVELIQAKRDAASDILRGVMPGLVAIIGPCALTKTREQFAEGGRITHFSDKEEGVVTLHRIPPWKPRTRTEDWHGLETTDPRGAYGTMHALASTNGNVALEYAHGPHAERYDRLTTFAWAGSRTTGAGKKAEILKIASHNPMLPFGVKNGLDGNVEHALEIVDAINNQRGEGSAPAVLVYRGGKNAQDPDSWADMVRRAHKLTDGSVIVDVAHGGEMAHDPMGEYGKSQIGQIACLATLARVAKDGFMPAGVMIESSDIESPTDPTIPLDLAFAAVHALNTVRQQQQ